MNTPGVRDRAGRAWGSIVDFFLARETTHPGKAMETESAARQRASDRNRRAVLTAGSALAARGITLGLTLLTVPLAFDHLGAERFGMWVTLSSLIAFSSLADLGIGYGLQNAVSRSLASDDVHSARREISSALAVVLALSAVVAMGFAFTFPFVPWADVVAVTSPTARSEAGSAAAVFFGLLILTVPLNVITQIRVARQQGYVVHAVAAAGNIAALGALLIVIGGGGGVPALVLAMAGPPALASAAHAVWLFRRSAPDLAPSFRLADFPTGWRLMRSGSLFLVLQLATTAAFATDTLIVAQLVGSGAVAEYGVALRLFTIPIGLVAISATPLWPAYAEAIASGDIPWVRATLRRSIRIALAISVPLATILVLWGRPITELWVGASVAPTFVLLLAFGLWTVQASVGHTIAMLLNGAHEIRLQALAAVAMAVANVALSIWLTTRIGVAGVVWGTVISYALLVLLPMAFYVPAVLRKISTHRMWAPG
jgi:O-antigen/teichoic acid export membrane protein